MRQKNSGEKNSLFWTKIGLSFSLFFFWISEMLIFPPSFLFEKYCLVHGCKNISWNDASYVIKIQVLNPITFWQSRFDRRLWNQMYVLLISMRTMHGLWYCSLFIACALMVRKEKPSGLGVGSVHSGVSLCTSSFDLGGQ